MTCTRLFGGLGKRQCGLRVLLLVIGEPVELLSSLSSRAQAPAAAGQAHEQAAGAALAATQGADDEPPPPEPFGESLPKIVCRIICLACNVGKQRRVPHLFGSCSA